MTEAVRLDTTQTTSRPTTGVPTRPDLSGPVSRPAPPQPQPRRRHVPAWHTLLTLLTLVALTAFGALLRAHGFSGLGLYRDDAWVALSGRVGIGLAWHMWATAPGWFFLVRTFTGLTAGTTAWQQVPAFVAGVTCIPAMYALSRWFRLNRLAALATAAAVSLSPMCVVYSTRVKEYEADLLVTCLLLALGEAARRRPGPRRVGLLAVASVVAFLLSASVAPVIVGAWIAVAVFTRRRAPRGWPRHVTGAAAATAVGCALVALAFYAHPSPAVVRFWGDAFLSRSSPDAFFSSLGSSTWHLFSSAAGLGSLSPAARALLLVAWFALMVVGLSRNAAMVAPAVAVAVAYVASAAHVEPLGTGRTDEYLYPALLLLTAAGATRVVVAAGGRLRRLPRPQVAIATATLAVGTLAVLVTGLFAWHAYATRPVYPGVDVRALAADLQRHEQPGDRIFVSELMRYPWALYETHPPDVVLGRDWSAGFTVESADPAVFIAPSEYYEGGSDPRAWAAQVSAEHPHRLWYVWSPPLAGLNPSYAALRADGWRPVTTLRATGCSATLLVRA